MTLPTLGIRIPKPILEILEENPNMAKYKIKNSNAIYPSIKGKNIINYFLKKTC